MNRHASFRPIHDPQYLAKELVARARAGNVDGMAALYETGAVLNGGGEMVVGREAIRAFYMHLVKTGVKFELGDQRAAIINGDLALTSTCLSNGIVTAEIARRQIDGTWLWAIDQPSIA